MKRLFLILALLLPAVASATDWLGDVPVGETVNFNFNTLGSDGAPITIAGTPAIEVYEDGGTTQITAGTTLTEDFDSVTGLHNIAIVATGANGYEAGKYYSVVIAGTTPTADSVSILGRVVARFRCIPAENVAGVPTVDIDYVGGTDEATALVDQADITGGAYALDTDANGRIRVVDGTGTGEIDTASGVVAANAVQVSGDSTAADNLETAFQSTLAEPTGVPAANAPLWTQIQYLYNFGFRNKRVADIDSNGDGELRYYDDGDAVEFEKDVATSGDATTESEAGAAD